MNRTGELVNWYEPDNTLYFTVYLQTEKHPSALDWERDPSDSDSDVEIIPNKPKVEGPVRTAYMYCLLYGTCILNMLHSITYTVYAFLACYVYSRIRQLHFEPVAITYIVLAF